MLSARLRQRKRKASYVEQTDSDDAEEEEEEEGDGDGEPPEEEMADAEGQASAASAAALMRRRRTTRRRRSRRRRKRKRLTMMAVTARLHATMTTTMISTTARGSWQRAKFQRSLRWLLLRERTDPRRLVRLQLLPPLPRPSRTFSHRPVLGIVGEHVAGHPRVGLEAVRCGHAGNA